MGEIRDRGKLAVDIVAGWYGSTVAGVDMANTSRGDPKANLELAAASAAGLLERIEPSPGLQGLVRPQAASGHAERQLWGTLLERGAGPPGFVRRFKSVHHGGARRAQLARVRDDPAEVVEPADRGATPTEGVIAQRQQ